MRIPTFKLSRGAGRIFLFVCCIALAIFVKLHPGTPEEIANRSAKDAALSARREHDVALCHLKAACTKYGDSRQGCATAGNFDNCMTVKMGDVDLSMVKASCSNDGALIDPPVDLPNDVACLAYNLGL